MPGRFVFRDGPKSFAALGFALLAATAVVDPASAAGDRPPNVVLIYIDDMGYGDIGPFGNEKYETPNLDAMAAQGRRFTDFLVSSAVCSASRAALLTGCYHERVSIRGAIFPNADHGLALREVTIAEICQQKDYATACFGKWHLGHHPKFLPTSQGFDEYFGLPYSNDMWPGPPSVRDSTPPAKWRFPPMPLVEGTKIVDADVGEAVQKNLTKWYTEHAVDFIDRNKDRPFFLYVPHSMVHVPLYVSEEFEGKTGKGLYADVVAEVDWSVGQIRQALADRGLAERTLIVFTTDNGPWLSYGSHGGTAGELREGKGTSFEGGVRVPTLMAWPGRIPAGTSTDTLCGTVDILPTVAAMIGAELPDHPIDGKSILEVMTGPPDVPSVHESMPIYYAGGELQAIRTDDWKLVLPHQYLSLEKDAQGYGVGNDDGRPVAYRQSRVEELQLYDMQTDAAEQENVADSHPEVVERLQAQAERWREELGDSLQKRRGSGIRPAGRLQPGEERLPLQ